MSSKKGPTISLRVSSAGNGEGKGKKYPKSARHAKTKTAELPLSKKKGGDVNKLSNIKPSSTRSSKYKDSSKRLRSKTTGNVLNGVDEDEDDEKFFPMKGKGKEKEKGKGKGKGKKKGKSNSEDLEEMEINLGDEFEMPDFIKNGTEELNRELTSFGVSNESDILAIEGIFEDFEKTLKERKEECIANAKNNYENDKYTEVKLDIDGTKEYLSQIGTILGEKEFELDKEQSLCIDKLREIIYFEDHSNDASEKLKQLKKELKIEADKLEKDKARVKAELAKVEPQLRAAQQAVEGIPKSSLDEFRALRKPAPILVDVVRAVAILVGKKEKDLKEWGNVRRLLDSKFIDFLLNFDARLATPKARKIIEIKYLDRPDFTFERINNASTVAGPFVFWLQSQIDYAKLLEKVAPIQREVDRLQDELKLNELRCKKLEQMLIELGKRVKQCRADMMEMVRKIVKLQDDIKEARAVHSNANTPYVDDSFD